MRIRHKKGTEEKLLQYTDVLVTEPHKNRGKWKEYFGNDNPMHLEIGSGFGQFIMALAERNPDINYIGLEKVEEVLIKTVQRASEKGLKNLKFLWFDARELEEIFATNEIAELYLNFSDPWPKKRHAKRRLTHGDFLAIYKNLLQEKGSLVFKTDGEALFEFSLNELAAHNWKFQNVCLDVVSRGPEDNVQTEYEQKFASQGLKIYRVEAIRP